MHATLRNFSWIAYFTSSNQFSRHPKSLWRRAQSAFFFFAKFLSCAFSSISVSHLWIIVFEFQYSVIAIEYLRYKLHLILRKIMFKISLFFLLVFESFSKSTHHLIPASYKINAHQKRVSRAAIFRAFISHQEVTLKSFLVTFGSISIFA